MPGPQVPTAGKLSKDPLAGFEQVSPEGHQARFDREHSSGRRAIAPKGQADFSAQAAPRGFRDVSAAGHAQRGNAPKRSKGKSTPSAEKMLDQGMD